MKKKINEEYQKETPRKNLAKQVERPRSNVEKEKLSPLLSYIQWLGSVNQTDKRLISRKEKKKDSIMLECTEAYKKV